MKQLALVLWICTAFLTLSAQDKKDETSKPSQEQSDYDFVMKAAESGLAEVMLGKLGKNRAESDDVKNYGKMMVEDHSKAGELKILVQKYQISFPAKLPPAVQKDYDALKNKSGFEFDKSFMEQMIADHHKAIALFEYEARNGDNDEIRAWAENTNPN